MRNHDKWIDDCIKDYNCPDCKEAKLQSDKNARKINEVIEQINKIIDYLENIGIIDTNDGNSDTVDYHHVTTLTISEYNSMVHDKDTLYFIKSEEE